MTGLRITTSLELNERQVMKIIADKADAAAEAGAEHLGDTADQTAPIEDGTLIRSRRVTRAEDGTAVTYYDTEYAVVQHEDLGLQHDSGRRAKWLERTMAEERGEVAGILQREMRL